jgi:hypothetical protein
VEERQPHVDLLLLVVAVLREASLEDHREEELAPGRLRRDRDEPAIAEERADDLLGRAQLPEAGAVGG